MHTISFNYYSSNSFYQNSTYYNASAEFQNAAGIDLGLRLADLNNDGLIDLIQGREGTEKKAWLNNKNGWSQTGLFILPSGSDTIFVDSTGTDKGLRIEDINGDGFPDLIQGWGGIKHAWLNNGTGFGADDIFWAPPADFADATGADEGTQFVDFNGDGKVDILQSKENGDVKKARDELMKKAKVKAESKSDRNAGDGLIHAYVHNNGKVGSMVLVACETDFVAKTDAFKDLCHEIALQVCVEEYTDIDQILDSEYIRNPEKKIKDLISETSAKVGEKIEIRGFSKFDVRG